ncbi:WWE protein-protein interaction domain protein family [Striga asiatica]|uniref:WWE protein-protein interaction domain protein family n=1 Tax=Striga asiatica TaxID=4170 RepID=A0A5A7P2M9_STRAF|nr:WWE protein-protein interaction domain protein family [Striga asiatica]
MSSVGSYHENSKPLAQTSAPLHDDNTTHTTNSYLEQDSYPSDCESGIYGPTDNGARLSALEVDSFENHKCEEIREAIEQKLVSRLSACGLEVRVESIRKNRFSDIMGRAKVESFSLCSSAVRGKCGGSANVKCAWFGASKNEIDMVISHGFGLPTTRRTNGQGVWLYSVNHPMESVHSALPDVNGLRHMLLCRVILGKTEVVCPGSEQNILSSEEFDSGVDNAVDPKKYVVWTPRMNTHILPEFSVSFRALSFKCRGFRIRQLSPNRLPYPILINILDKYLPFDAVELVTKHHDDFKNKKITRTELIEHTRHIVGDKLLLRIIEFYERKVVSC